MSLFDKILRRRAEAVGPVSAGLTKLAKTWAGEKATAFCMGMLFMRRHPEQSALMLKALESEAGHPFEWNDFPDIYAEIQRGLRPRPRTPRP